MSGRRVLITGATSGIGREMAIQLGRERCRVAITGRRRNRLEGVAAVIESVGGECLVLEGSVTDPETVKRHYAAIRDRWGGLDWAILNAGVGAPNSARDFRAEPCHATLDTNVGGVANWLEVVLPDMLAAGQGTIAGIASLAAYRGLPGAGSYAASKAALLTLLESVRVDLRGTGVAVVTVCPGFIKTEMTEGNDPGAMPFLVDAADAARRILRGIERRRRMVHFPWVLAFFVKYVLHTMPDSLYEWLATRGKRSNPGSPP